MSHYLLAGVSALQLAMIGSTAFLALCMIAGRLAFLRTEFAAPWRRTLAAGLLAGILAAVVFYPVTGGRFAPALDIDDLWFPALFLGHGLLVLFLVGWWSLQPPQSVRPFLAIATDHLGADVGYGIALGIAGWFVTILVTLSVAALATGLGGHSSAPLEVPQLIVWLAHLPLAKKLVVITTAMTVEEAFFRGFLQPRFGLWLSSALFALAHASYGLPFMMISVLTISLLIGRVFRQRGRLLPCIVAHGVFDAIQLLVVLPWAVQLLRDAT